jgi:ribonuclease M5
MLNKKISAVIVVEGKKDTQRLRLIDPEVKTIETRGSAINHKLIQTIQKIKETNEVVVLTDPDFSGERIRRLISAEIPDIKQAFLRQKDAIPTQNSHHHSLGVEHASEEAILLALKEVSRSEKKSPALISRTDLLRLKLINYPEARRRREYISEKLNLGYVNSAHLAQRLQLLGIGLTELENTLIEVDNEQI